MVFSCATDHSDTDFFNSLEHYGHMRALHGGLVDEYEAKLRRLEMANGQEKETA